MVVDLSSSFGYWKSRYFFVSGDGWETLSDDLWENVPRLLRRWETPLIGAFAPYEMPFTPFLLFFFLKIFF